MSRAREAATVFRVYRESLPRLPVVVAERLPRGCLRFYRGCRMVVFFVEMDGCRAVADPSGNRQETVTTAVDGWRRLLIVVALKLSVIVCQATAWRLPLPASHPPIAP